MNDQAKRAVGVLLDKVGNPVIAYLLRTKFVPTEAQIEKELAAEYGKIADRMAGRESKFPCPVEDPEFASKIVREAFEETKKEIGSEHKMTEARKNEVKEKVKMRVMKKLGLER